jgi:Fic family protein
MFYLSAYLEEHRDEYYSRLQAISRQGDWNGWIEFFLQAVHVQARENSERVKATMALYEEMKLRIAEVTHSRFAIQVLDALFDRPVFQASDFVQRTEIRRATALGLLRQLRENGVIAELRPGAGSRAGTLIFAKLLNIAEGRKVF